MRDPATRSGEDRRLVVAITGATGAIYGVRLLERLAEEGVHTHLVISRWGRHTIEHETPYSVYDVRALAGSVHPVGDQAAPISSGSFGTAGMVVAPCTTRTLAAIAHGLGDNLVVRAADVTLKERRRLVLMVRETPLSEVHLENMLRLTRAGAVVFPPVPSFYTGADTVADQVDYTVSRVLDQFDMGGDDKRRWDGELRT